MKLHSNNFKEQIKKQGRELDSIITIGSTVLGKENLNTVTPSYQGAILKSVMKQLNIDSNVNIPLNSVLNYKFGVKVNGEYEYIDFGNYVVYKSEKQEDTSSYKITCYDKMLYSMVEYKALQHGQFPMTIREYIKNLCLDCGLVFKNENDEFANYDKILDSDPYSGLEYTYRDVFDELSQVTASVICLDNDDKVEIRYINETNDTIDEEYLKDVNVNFGEKYGKINSIVLSRSGESDNVYLRDEQSVIKDGLCELKIIDNQIMNFNNRSQFLPDILEKINGLEYYLNDFTSTGIVYYDVCDRYSVKIGDKTYSCVMFNDEINITQGLEEIIYTEMPEETETDYTKADKTDRKINQAYIIVDKQNQEIQALASKIIELSTTETGKGQVKFESATLGALDKLSITGNVKLVHPSSDKMGGMNVKSGIYKSGMIKASSYKSVTKALYPSNDLYPLDTYLIIKQEDKEVFRHRLPIKELNAIGNVSDEFVWQYNKMKLIHRIGVATNGDLYILPQEYEEDLGELEIVIPEGDGYFIFESFPYSIISITYMLKNEYTETFATKAELESEIKVTTDSITSTVSATFETKENANKQYSQIKQTTDSITSTVSKKIGSEEVVSSINQSAEEIQLKSNRLVVDSNNFKMTKEGNLTCNNSNMNSATMNDVTINNGEITLTGENWSDSKLNIISESNNDRGSLSPLSLTFTSQSFNVDAQHSMFGVMAKNNSGDYANYECNIAKIMNGNNTTSYMTALGVWSSAFNNTSLESKKKNIVLDDGCLKEILKTDITSFNWNYEDDDDQKHIGLIIPDKGGNYKVSPKVLTHDKDAVDLYSMVGMSWKAIQELYDIIKEKDNKIKELEERLNGIIESNQTK